MIIETFPIRTVGPAKIKTPLDLRTPFVSDQAQVFYDREADGAKKEFQETGKIHAFEKAGPRDKIFFDPNWCKAGILTAGGLCPGLNDVIKGLTLTLRQTYGVPLV